MSETRYERAERRIREFEYYLEQARNKLAKPVKCDDLTTTHKQGKTECRRAKMKPMDRRNTKH